VILAALALLVPRADVVRIDSSEGALVHPPRRDQALRFAIAPVISPERGEEDYQRLAGWLGERLRRPVRIVQRRTYGEVNDLLRTSAVDVAVICTGAYLRGRAAGMEVDIVAVPMTPRGPQYESLIIVPRGSGLESFADAAGGRLAFADPLSLSGHFYPLSLAIERGLDPAAVLRRAVYTYSHDNSIHAVADGIVDGAAVDSLVWDYELEHDAETTRDLIVLERSPPLAIHPVVVPRSLDRALAQRIRAALLDLDASPEGPLILDRLGLVSFELPIPGLYDEVEERINQVVAALSEAG